MSRFEKTRTEDLLQLLRWAPRRRTNPFAVMEALRDVLARRVSPPDFGAAVLAFDATLAAEARDALERERSAIARFLQATVPPDTDGLRVETAWQSAAHALTRLVRLEKKPRKAALEALQKLRVDDVFLEGAQVALATADVAEVETNRWFFPLLVLDGSEASVDALMPHLSSALDDGRLRAALAPLVHLPSRSTALVTVLQERVGAQGR